MMERATLLFFLCWLRLVSARSSYPLGIYFGPEYITAAHFLTNNDPNPVLVARILGSPDYVEYMKDTSRTIANIEKPRKWADDQWMEMSEAGALVPAPLLSYDEGKAHLMFQIAFESVKRKYKMTPGNLLSVGAVSHPVHFNFSCANTVEQTLVEFYPSFKADQVDWHIPGLFDAARFAYGFDSCLGFGLESSKCMFRGQNRPQNIVVVDYNRDSLTIIFGQVTGHQSFSDYYVHIGNFKSDKLLLTKSKGFMHYRKVRQRYLRPAQDRHDQFLEAFVDFMEARFPDADAGFSCKKLRLLILSGEAEPAEMDRMRATIKKVIPPAHQHKIKDTIDPAYVMAIGAAYVSRDLIKNPIVLDDIHAEL